jgi:hypothetical protein
MRIENLAGFDRLQARFRNIINPDATDLMVTWQQIIRKDTRDGVLAGLDKDGVPMAPVKYRPIVPVWDRKTTAAQRLGQRASRKTDLRFGGFGPQASGLHNNLTGKEYRRLGGPPTAPRGQFSRVISNLLTGYGREADYRWFAMGYWDEVVDEDGVPFLHHLFNGGKNLPKRDLRGVRPAGIARAQAALRAWMIDRVRSSAA